MSSQKFLIPAITRVYWIYLNEITAGAQAVPPELALVHLQRVAARLPTARKAGRILAGGAPGGGDSRQPPPLRRRREHVHRQPQGPDHPQEVQVCHLATDQVAEKAPELLAPPHHRHVGRRREVEQLLQLARDAQLRLQ